MFALLAILIEDFPNDYARKLDSEVQQILIKTWIDGLFEVKKSDSLKDVTTDDKVKLIMNNVVDLPFCKCKAKLRALNNVNAAK